MEIKSKAVHLQSIFIKYLCLFCCQTIGLLLIIIAFFGILLYSGQILPANYSEKIIEEVKEEMISQNEILPELIPNMVDYAVFEDYGNILYGNIKESKAKEVYEFFRESDITQSMGTVKKEWGNYYTELEIKDKVCIFRYNLYSQFKSEVLRKSLPHPELLGIILFILIFFLEVVYLGLSFQKQIVKKMDCLYEITEKIKNQDLEFNVQNSGVHEINNVLGALIKMRDSLKETLKKQWELEEAKQDQISALSHDIKTPVTVIRGNVELLLETELNNEQEEYAEFIYQSVLQINDYTKTLIEISKSEMKNDINKNKINTHDAIEEFYKMISGLLNIKNLQLELNKVNIPEEFYADLDLLKRAIMNVVYNALDYSEENGKIIFNCEGDGENIIFTIIDYGKGFSKEDLAKGTKEFYMGDSSRGRKNHYGMGLYITKNIIMKHNGTFKLRNSEITNGAEIEISIPISL